MRSAVLGFVVLALLACGDAAVDESGPSHSAEAIADQEDAVCGMLVRNQSAPRAQVVHRDGSRFFFCSIGDLLVHRAAPSPHGRIEATFVEVMDPSQDPLETHEGEHAWTRAEDATYVVGVKRRGIMGAPVLVYGSEADATAVVDAHAGAAALAFDDLVAWWERRNET